MDNNLMDDEVVVNEIACIIMNARNNVIKKVNTELISAYWNIGRIIVENELKSGREEYGKNNYLFFQKLLPINLEKDFQEQIYKI